MRIQRIVIVGFLGILLGLVWSMLPDRAEAAKNPPLNCAHMTAAAVFGDDGGDGIRSDGQTPYPIPLYGSPSEYHGWEDSTVCLMEFDDYDFIMGTAGTKFELNGWNRKVTLDFTKGENDPVPFASPLAYEVTIRSDYIYNLAEAGPVSRRLILWFTANRIDYKLYFDDNDADTDMVQVTLTGSAPNRVWTIISNGYGRLEGPRRVGIVGYFYMPFQLKIYETNKPKTCF